MENIPTITVSSREYNKLAYERVPLFEMGCKRARKALANTMATMTSDENIIRCIDFPTIIRFKKRWSDKSIERRVYIVELDESDRFNRVARFYLR